MSIALTINGTTYQYPETNNQKWGPDATQWASAVTSGMLQKAGGLFQLLAEVDFGTAFGVKSLYFKSRTASTADAGQLRLARADVVSWRNQAGDGNLDLSVNSSNVLLFNGVALGNFVSVLDTNSIDLTLSSGVLSSDLKLSSAAATAGSFKVTNSISSDGLLSQATIATTSLTGFLSSTDWNTFNGKQAAGNYITALTGDGSASGPGSAALTLATVNANVGTFASFTVNGKGLVTAATALSGDATTSGAVLTLATVNSNVGTFASSTVNAKGLVTAAANLSGDATTSGSVLTLATVNSNVGSFGGATTSGTFTVNAKGLITAASSTSIQIAESQVTNLTTDLAAKQSTTLTSAHILVGNVSNVAADVAMSGDITIGNTGVTAIGSNKVTNAMLAQVSTATFKGRTTAGTGNVEDLTATQATALLNVMTGDAGSGGLKGLVPAQATGDATKFLNGAGAWSTPSGAGDVTGPGSATGDHVVFFNGSTGKLIKDSGLTLAGTNTGDVTLVNTTNGLTISGQALTMAVAASGVSGSVSATTQTFTGIKTFETQLIGKGTATNDNAAAGYIGEVIDSGAITTVNGTNATYVNIGSISLTAGDWDVTGIARSDLSTGTGVTRTIFAISINSGNTTTDQVPGYNQLEVPPPTATADGSCSVPNYRITVASGTTTVYWKVRIDFSGGTPRVNGARLFARRCR